MDGSALTTFLGQVGSFLTESLTWLSNVLTTITDNPALFVLVVAMPIAGFAVGLLSRLIRL